MAKLSILIPARNEEWLQRTINDIFKHAEGEIEVLVALDNWEDVPEVVVPHGLVIHTSAGQRGATNVLAELATGKYVMKLDAHCSFPQGFDIELVRQMEESGDDTTLVPALGNLHVYNWVCPQGHKHFQGKYEQCEQCGSTKLTKEVVWQVQPRPIMTNYYFDTNLHFQYCPEQSKEMVTETMSIQGSGFLVTKQKYFELNLCDEAFGSWGQQGVEVAVKTWLSGGKCLSTKNIFYGHMFRETEGFPYLNPPEKIIQAQKFSRDLFLGNKWPLQKKPIQWLIEKFGYQGDWTPGKIQELCSSWYNNDTASLHSSTGEERFSKLS